MSQLEVRREQEGNVTIVSFRGEFDYAEMGMAQEEICAAEAQESPVLVLDLSDLEFMDSSAVRVILQADSRARADGRRLALVTGTGPPHRVLSILGLTDRLDVVTSRDAVLRP
jgi:anti-sigma B factor antagonist